MIAPADDRARLAELLARTASSGGVTVRSLRRQPFEHATAFAAEHVTAELSDGRSIEAFLKDFSRSRLEKPALAARRAREMAVYTGPLRSLGLGTPRCYATVNDEHAERYGLLLEFVHGRQLRWCGTPAWAAAAAWLGRLHARAGGVAAAEDPRLVTHDRAFFLGQAEAALRALTAVSRDLARRLRPLLAGYEELAELMAGAGRTLVHGSYRPQNVIVAGARTCPIDWELAARGSPFYDLAYLVDGWEGTALGELLDAYVAAAAQGGASTPERDELCGWLGRFGLHKLVASLGHCAAWKDPAATAGKLLDRAERLRGAVA